MSLNAAPPLTDEGASAIDLPSFLHYALLSSFSLTFSVTSFTFFFTFSDSRSWGDSGVGVRKGSGSLTVGGCSYTLHMIFCVYLHCVVD